MMRRALRGWCLGLGLACAAAPPIQPGQAAEGGALAYTPGAPGPFVGLFPLIPGVFLLSQNFVLPTAGLYGRDGRRLAIPIKAETQGSAERFVIAYPEPVLGARFYQQVIVPLVNVSVTSFGQKDGEFGLGNVLVSPAILSWQVAPFQTVTTGLDVATELSTYNGRKAVNVANGYTSFQPVAAYRYFDPTGWAVGAAARLLLNTRNDFDRYQSGSAFAVDFDAGYNVGDWRVGVVGGYGHQFEDDRQFGARLPGGNRTRSLTVGPSVTYALGPVFINVNYQFGVLAENTVKADVLWVNIAVPLYAAGGPPAPPPVRPLVSKF